MKKKIYYITQLKSPNKDNRIYSNAAISKSNYIISVLNHLNYHVNVISPNWTKNNFGFYKGHKFSDRFGNYYRYLSTFGSRIIIFNKFKYLYSGFLLMVYLLFKIKKSDTILYYHSVFFSPVIQIIKIIKRFTLIIQLEEIYHDVVKMKSWIRKIENSILINNKYFILSNDILMHRLNIQKEHCVVLYGDYSFEPFVHNRKMSKKVKIVYAGTFDLAKAGFKIAIKSAEYLKIGRASCRERVSVTV
jgi:hypothetical protein